ncbi:glycosyltransferase [Halorientalis marina]|uniref:glycosyltransferase n=1 Tax=Halorientalis marina TaxID=2931976 RepID=UPI001FF1B154|nr:glycosyltransferase [Halorientalis marina]
MTRSIGLVVPAYDPAVEKTISYVRSVRAEIPLDSVRIELDAPDSDSMRERLSVLDATVNVSPTRRGKGAAITHGFDALDTDVLAFADADGSTPPASLRAVIEGTRDAEVSVGSRRHPDATIASNQSLVRQRMGDVFALMARNLLGVDLYDFQCGAKALTSEAWTTIREHVEEPGFAWDLAVIGMAEAYGMEVTEVPVTWEDQPGSTVDPIRTALELGVALVSINHRMKLVSGNQFHRFVSRARDGLPEI